MPFDIADKLPPALTKKIGPLPVYAWIGAGAVGIGVVLYMKKHGGNPVDSTSGDYTDPSTDEAGYPFAVGPPVMGSTGGGGGGGGGGGTVPPDAVPATPPPSTLPQAVRSISGNCGPGFCWNGIWCVPKLVSGPCRAQPGAEAPAKLGSRLRRCPPTKVWNGTACVPRIRLPQKKQRGVHTPPVIA